MDRPIALSRMEDTDGVDVLRKYSFAVITLIDPRGHYYIGQLVALEWEGDNSPREIGIGQAKPGKLDAEYDMYGDFFEAVDAAREIQIQDMSERSGNDQTDRQERACWQGWCDYKWR